MTGAALLALAPSPFATVQDGGRIGWRRFGLTGAGAMDREALVVANALVGNAAEAACVEFAHAGGAWAVRRARCRVAIAGGAFAASLGGVPLAPLTSAIIRPGQVLRIGGTRGAVWGYLAVSGGLLVPREFGSRSTHVRSAVGGMQGRVIQAGDELPLAAEHVLSPGERTLIPPQGADRAPIRVVLGPQHDHFTQSSVEAFLSAEYAVTWQGDRMGYRLDGPQLAHRGSFNIVSDGLLPGSIQVPGNGQPIVLMMDAQTTGGYPKIATVVTADLGRFAQRRPGSRVRFRAIDLDDAQLLRREFVHRLRATHLRVADAASVND